MKILLLGHMKHGKDTIAEMIHQMFGLNYISSSQAAADLFIFNELKNKYGYKTPEECFEDRVNHRKEWFDLIEEYNSEDKARLAKEILSICDIYVGMRSQKEIEECWRQGVFDFVIGVYDPRKVHEPEESFQIDLFQEADIIIPNGGSLGELEFKVYKLISNILKQ